jgi:hypothetical protein
MWTSRPHKQVMSMNSSVETAQTAVAVRLRQILLEPARREDDMASSQAAVVPYWAPHPSSVIGHRVAADALRSEADRFLEAS